MSPNTTNNNPAAARGWVKSTDPKTGRVFYANHITRKTQWEAPDGWVEAAEQEAPPPPSSMPASQNQSHGGSASFDQADEASQQEPLPSNWEEMHDPTTGKPFYVDHERKITTWTRPKKAEQASSSSGGFGGLSLQPAPSSGGANSAALARILAASSSNPQQQHGQYHHHSSSNRSTSSYSEYSYSHNFAPTNRSSEEVDLSDSLPPLDFQVQKVADAFRPNCPHCSTEFTLSKRRHHCRLCGDVFCDACSSHRVTLPLEGSEFDKPVRICDFCHVDVDQHANFFSLRRYLTPLHLYNGKKNTPLAAQGDNEHTGVATVKSVNAALAALAVDIDQMIQNCEGSLDKVTIPPDILVPEIIKHLNEYETSNRAVRAIASLLALENMAGPKHHEYAIAVYLYGGKSRLDNILDILDRNGTDRKTLYVQELAVRTLYYLTEAKTILAAQQKQAEMGGDNNYHDDDDADDINDHHRDHEKVGTVVGGVEDLDMKRLLRSLLDHSSASKNPNLQRWSAATIRNIVQEDQRRACMEMNDIATLVACGGETSTGGRGGGESLKYKSVLEELVNTGGIMILCSLIGTDDADTRAHAVGALGATLASTRAVNSSMQALNELSNGRVLIASQPINVATIVSAIVAGGGCASSISQLLLSADHQVASLGCGFLSSLVMPLLSDPMASAALPSQYDYNDDRSGDASSSGLAACREAAIEIATDSCLPALLSLAREQQQQQGGRPMELRKMAIETLAAVVMTVCLIGKSWSANLYEEGLERTGAPAKLKDAIMMLNEEGCVDVALDILQSTSAGQTLGGSSKETPASRIRESAGIILGSLTSCSAESIMELQSRNVLSQLLIATNDTASMTTQSTLRGDAAPKCLGVLEALSSVLIFAWQHSDESAASELLDRLIEMIDAGVVPYLSRVINAKIDWELKDKSCGGMKARTASCKLLCCLFGIALNDGTGIGLRRLMDAVETDSRSYRQVTSSKDGGKAASTPRNILETTLGTLQTSSNLARRSLVGTLNQGAHYQAALMELVDAALLAVGSMCGSSVAPGGSEGTMISGEAFLATARNDQYANQRRGVCRVACDVVVRGSNRSGQPSLLPTMLVGGFGENTILSSLRLALAIAQNGSKEEHAKLAMSGLLVPISDSLRASLSNGDLYRFSASLALVRFCGPHVAAGQQGGGIESVRDAIRVATNVLTLPVNPSATIEQMDLQDSLKSECIAALESLSRNASLWSAISTEALPSIVQFLNNTASLKVSSSGNTRRQTTRCTALKAVLQIVQVPSHAVTAAEAGIVDPLGKLLRKTADSDDNQVPMLALEILHAIASNKQARQRARFLESGLVRSICSALGKAVSAAGAADAAGDNAGGADATTSLGLNILHAILSDIEAENNNETSMVLQSRSASAFLDAVVLEPKFVSALCSTLLLSTNMKLQRHDVDGDGEYFDIPKLYGPPLLLVNEKCGGLYDNTHEAAAAFLYTVSVYACAVDSKSSEEFWKTVLQQQQQQQQVQSEQDAQSEDLSVDRSRLAATLCAHYLALLTNDYEPFVPTDAVKKQDYIMITRPLVRYRLLESFKDLMEDLTASSSSSSQQLTSTYYGDTTSNSNSDPYVISLLVEFNVPHICLSLWKDPAILDLAFDLIKQIVEQEPDEVLHLFVDGKSAIMSLFGLLNEGATTSNRMGEIRRFLASILGQLAESGLLTSAVEKYDVRSSAIAALASACLNEEERPPSTSSADKDDDEDDEDMTSARLSSVLMRCLVDLCTVTEKGGRSASSNTNLSMKRIRLSSSESEAIARNLGKKICQMVLTRFLERAKLEQYEMENDEDITDAPDVAMLCAIAQHDEALSVLMSIGGLHALSLVAAEGEISAMVALKKACKTDASVLLDGDTYQSVMGLLVTDEDHDETPADLRLQLHSSAFELLARLCSGSVKGRSAVSSAESCQDCLVRAMDAICLLTEDPEEKKKKRKKSGVDTDDDTDGEESSTDGESEDMKVDDYDENAIALPEDDVPPSYEALASSTKKPAVPVATPPSPATPRDNDQELGIAACAFISSLVPSRACRDALLSNEDCLSALAALVTDQDKNNGNDKLAYACLKVLTALAPYANFVMNSSPEEEGATTTLTADHLAQVLLSVLTSGRKIRAAADGSLNSNLIYDCAVTGLNVVFDCVNAERQLLIAESVSTHFRTSVKTCSVTRATSREAEKAHSAEFTYNLTHALLLVRGKDFSDEIFNKEFITSFIHLTQWRYDPKTSLGNTNQRCWDAAVSNCLLLLSTIVWKPESVVIAKNGITLKALACGGSNPLMLARPGKAPRKAIDFKVVLERLAAPPPAAAAANNNNDAAVALSAQRIIDRLF